VPKETATARAAFSSTVAALLREAARAGRAV